MNLFEIADEDQLQTAYYDPERDKINTRIPTDTRKPLLTLRKLNRLKKLRALRRLEKLKQHDLFGVMYALPDEDSGMGGLGGMGGPGL